MPVDCVRRRCWRTSGTGSSEIWPFRPPGTTNGSKRFGRVAAIRSWCRQQSLRDARRTCQRNEDGSVLFPQADAGVVVLKDAVEGGPGLGHSEAADLAQAHAVAPSLAREDEARDVPGGVALAVDHEQVLSQPQTPAHAQAIQDQLPVAADDGRLDHATGDPEALGDDVPDLSDRAVTGDGLRDLVRGHAHLPAVILRRAVRG